VHLT